MTDSCTATVYVNDVTAPVLTSPNDYGVQPNGIGAYIIPDYFDIGTAEAIDNCTNTELLILTQDPAPGTMIGWNINPYLITFTAEDEYGNIATCSFELTVEAFICFSVSENRLLNKLVISPIPATDTIKIINNSSIELESAIIYDLNGKIVQEVDLQDFTIDISNLPIGICVIKIIADKSTAILRFIKE